MKRLSIRERVSDRRGLNLIELAIVMAVVGLIIGGIYIAASSVYRNVRESTTSEDLLQVVQNVKSTYGAQGQIIAGAITATQAQAAGLVPADMIQIVAGAPTFVNAFGGTVTLNGVAGPPGQVQITFNGIPQSVCSDLAVKTTSVGVTGAANSGLESVTVGATLEPQANFPITPVTASGACTSPTGPIEFVYNIN